MTRNFDRSGSPMRRVAVALAAVLALNPGVALAGAGASNEAGAAAVSAALTVQSEPAGANVYVDGRLAGNTPLQVGSLTPGDHRVRVVKDGFLENARIVSVGTTPKNVLVKLTPHTGTSNASAEQVSGGGGGGGLASNKWLWIGIAGGGAVAAALLLTGGNKAPTAGSVAANPSSGLASGTSITFTAQGANDPDGDNLTFNWDFGDSTSGTGGTVSKTYANAGTFNATVTVSDGKKSATASASVTIRNLTGSWAGTYALGASTAPFNMNLTQSGGNVSGSYSDPDGPGTVAGTVSAGNAVRLVVTQAGFAPLTLQGTSDNGVATINGTVPSGFVGVVPTFTMRR